MAAVAGWSTTPKYCPRVATELEATKGGGSRRTRRPQAGKDPNIWV